MKILSLFEYSLNSSDAMMADLLAGLESELSGAQIVHRHGWFSAQQYVPGGLRMTRLLNMAFMFLMLPWWMGRNAPDFVLVRSTPPLLQWAAAFWAPFFRAKVICWLMDYHPELEARAMERKRGLKPLAETFRALDRVALRRMHAVVTLDDAMAHAVRRREPRVPICIHPTWNHLQRQVPRKLVHDPKRLTIAYAGNLGPAHDFVSIERFLSDWAKRTRLRLVAVGTSGKGHEFFTAVAEKAGFDYSGLERRSFEELGCVYEEYAVDLGMVSMKQMAAGILSPSKFTGYIHHGLPVLYLGPAGTNAHRVCESFAAGVAIDPEDQISAPEAVYRRVRDLLADKQTPSRVANASQAFAALDGNSLARMLKPALISPHAFREQCEGRALRVFETDNFAASH